MPEMYIGEIITSRSLNATGCNEHPRTDYTWKCSCGATNLTEYHKQMPSRKYKPDYVHFGSSKAAEHELDKHLESHHRNARNVPDAFPNADTTHDVQTDIPINQGVPEQSPRTFRNAITIDVKATTIDYTDRWMLFTDDELNLLSIAIFEGSEPEVLYEEINTELIRRNRPDLTHTADPFHRN